jgi:hypothetical protein
LIFESDRGTGELISKYDPRTSSEAAVFPGYSNDNSPCVLPSGHVVSLWCDNDSAGGIHQLKVSLPSVSGHFVLMPEVDVTDAGIACSATID